MKAHYFSSSVWHYRVVKALIEMGAVRLKDTWKFKHHAIKVPTVTTVDRIVQAMCQIIVAVKGTNNPLPD